MFVPAERWYCCLTAADQAAVSITAAAFTAALMQPIPADVFDTAWGLTLLYVTGQRDQVLALYALEDTFIVIPDAPPIPAVGIVDVLLWLDIAGFLLTGGGDCAGGCDAPTWSIQ